MDGIKTKAWESETKDLGVKKKDIAIPPCGGRGSEKKEGVKKTGWLKNKVGPRNLTAGGMGPG